MVKKKMLGVLTIAALSVGFFATLNPSSPKVAPVGDWKEMTQDIHGVGIRLANGDVLDESQAVAYSPTYAQYGMDSAGRYCLRFATAVKGNITSLSYTRAKVDALNKEEVTKTVNTIYRGVQAAGEVLYYDGTNYTADETYAGEYYWACYTICFSQVSAINTDVSVHLTINGEALPVKTTNLADLLSQDGICYDHAMVKYPGKEVKYNADGEKEHYQCEKCLQYYLDAEGKQPVSKEELVIASDGWLRFGLSTSTDGTGVKSERAMIEDTIFEHKEVLGSHITFTENLNAGTSYFYQTHANDASDGVNARVRQEYGKTLEYKVIVKNNTEKPLNLKILLNDVDANSAVAIQLQGNEKKVLEGSYVCGGSTSGGWMKAEIVDAVEAGSSFDFVGYMKTKDYWQFEDKNLYALQEATTKVFKVGETFQSDGLLLHLKNDSVFQDTVVNYATNYDGHVFTEEDLGTKTVHVQFGGAHYEYDIKVLPAGHVHSFHHSPAVPVTYNADGVKEYYYCDGCDKYFADAAGNTEIGKDSLAIASEGWLRFGISTSTDGAGVKSERAMIQDTVFESKEVLGSRITFSEDLAAGVEYNYHTHANTKDGLNARVRQIAGKTMEYKAIVKNNTEKPLNITIRLNDVDANSAIVIQLQGNESKVLEGSYVCNGNTPGGWMKAYINEAVEAGSSFDFVGYMKTKDFMQYDSALQVLQEASKKTFKVGETFQSDGFMAYISNDGCNDTMVNYVTNYDGHVFTADDVGTKTVLVKFGSATYEYQITVEA